MIPGNNGVTISDELLHSCIPCPFCGEKPKYVRTARHSSGDYTWVHSIRCDCDLSPSVSREGSSGYATSETCEQAIARVVELWNRRATNEFEAGYQQACIDHGIR